MSPEWAFVVLAVVQLLLGIILLQRALLHKACDERHRATAEMERAVCAQEEAVAKRKRIAELNTELAEHLGELYAENAYLRRFVEINMFWAPKWLKDLEKN